MMLQVIIHTNVDYLCMLCQKAPNCFWTSFRSLRFSLAPWSNGEETSLHTHPQNVTKSFKNPPFVVTTVNTALVIHPFHVNIRPKEIIKYWLVGYQEGLLLLLHYNHLWPSGFCPGLPGWASTRKVKPIWILLKQETVRWQWYQLGHMQICTSPQTDNYTSTQLLSFLQARYPSCHPTNSVKTLKAVGRASFSKKPVRLIPRGFLPEYHSLQCFDAVDWVAGMASGL